ncbi:MAG: transglutaminase domain-containing protein [candidate division KSB1 bacterium]|nr:transglutaminase domain-containing protein [candidate division KSB1 bacterium]MDZ7379023.1 transglutaminase domain-containing protein [candidate division KSB1 bacterium]MDZ7412594.1 transglutaminase domain-containing protein [candidate division KSB1 bacterium]
MKYGCVLTVMVLPGLVLGQGPLAPFEPLIAAGEFAKAQQAMRLALANNPDMPALDRLALEFEIERLERIRKDFTTTRNEVLEQIRLYIPTATEADLVRWEEARALESMVIDGQKWYFARAASNLFRLDKEARRIKLDYDKKHGLMKKPAYVYEEDAAAIIQASETLGTRLVKPKRFRITYTLSVHADAVPPGEVIRAWLPYPREGNRRQQQIVLESASPSNYLIADNERYLQRTIYFEQKATAGKPTVFRYTFSFTSYAEYNGIDPARVQPYDTSSALYKENTREVPPHIVFTDELRAISKQIVGNESNPYLKAKRIFAWVDQWVPWAGAREYSTIRNIPMYAYRERHGDCGMQTLLFMTLARMNGIPVHWQSGYEMMPGQESMHDWCEMYLEPYGWVLVDQSYGLKESKDERVRWFCLGNTDPYRWIVNDDFSQPLYPAKIYPRSETVDFQRGEVEWRGGNLYFDTWDYDWQVERLD